MTHSNYSVFIDGEFKNLSLGELAKRLFLPHEISISKYSNDGSCANIWSARLSTGLFGLTSCESGNRGPKGYNEVMLAVGDEGLNKLVEFGFITCPSCHPEKIDGFWKSIKDTIIAKYDIKTLEDYVNKKILPFDARRVNWEEILPIVGQIPNRIYIPAGLPTSNITTFNKRFTNLGFKLPPIGYYNPEVPERFTEYQIPTS